MKEPPGPSNGWCRGRESNPYRACTLRDFKSLASASSATPAHDPGSPRPREPGRYYQNGSAASRLEGPGTPPDQAPPPPASHCSSLPSTVHIQYFKYFWYRKAICPVFLFMEVKVGFYPVFLPTGPCRAAAESYIQSAVRFIGPSMGILNKKKQGGDLPSLRDRSFRITKVRGRGSRSVSTRVLVETSIERMERRRVC